MALYKLFTSFFLGGLLSLITITNPISKVPLFLSLVGDTDRTLRKTVARQACIYAFWIMAGSLFAGVLVLQTFGISHGALRIAGGLTILVLGYRMLFETSGPAQTTQAAHANVAFFPLALPGISGPGTIATVIGISTEISELHAWGERVMAYVATILSIFFACLVMWFTLRSAHWASRRAGADLISAATRLMGFLLICIGVQFIGSGIKTFIANMAGAA